MKIARFDDNRLGLVEGDQVKDVTAALDVLPRVGYPLPLHDPLIAHLDTVCAEIRRLAPSAPSLPLAGRTWLAPVANPGKIVAAPVNYQKHLDEAREQVEIHHNNQVIEIQKIGLFLKATSSLVGPSAGVAIEHLDRRNDHEAELVVIIGQGGRNITRANAMRHVAAYTSGLDMTVRGPEERSLRKSVDSYSVLGPWLVTADEIPHPDQMDFSLHVNGELRQRGDLADLIWNNAEIIAELSSLFELRQGDLIYTGTPAGVAAVRPGDRLEAGINGLGSIQLEIH